MLTRRRFIGGLGAGAAAAIVPVSLKGNVRRANPLPAAPQPFDTFGPGEQRTIDYCIRMAGAVQRIVYEKSPLRKMFDFTRFQNDSLKMFKKGEGPAFCIRPVIADPDVILEGEYVMCPSICISNTVLNVRTKLLANATLLADSICQQEERVWQVAMATSTAAAYRKVGKSTQVCVGVTDQWHVHGRDVDADRGMWGRAGFGGEVVPEIGVMPMTIPSYRNPAQPMRLAIYAYEELRVCVLT